MVFKLNSTHKTQKHTQYKIDQCLNKFATSNFDNKSGFQPQTNITTIQPNYNQSVPPGFLVWSPGCQMPALDPLAADVMKLFDAEKYEECSSLKPLTRIHKNFNNNAAYLIVDEKRRESFLYKHNKLDCCWQEIIRSGSTEVADDHFK